MIKLPSDRATFTPGCCQGYSASHLQTLRLRPPKLQLLRLQAGALLVLEPVRTGLGRHRRDEEKLLQHLLLHPRAADLPPSSHGGSFLQGQSMMISS